MTWQEDNSALKAGDPTRQFSQLESASNMENYKQIENGYK
jgi:hypothetical protein